MTIIREGGEIIIKLSEGALSPDRLQRLLNYLQYSELTSKKTVDQSTVDELSKEVNKGWWERNKGKFLNE